ncbi:hypothetical protein SAMN05421756_103458 [Microlunatus flavus]|uniref:Uncharacterized protein n=1 Tax=Microlunatus flavus TaxID=1036181 RepID=A0A1H9G0Y6_9ACTN|nr:hypothetical protein SAMN05421756_103458 [Microlunatus flavus]
MTTAPLSPFVVVGDPTAAACEGDFCLVPDVDDRVGPPEDQEQDAPVEEAHAPAVGP